MLKIKSAFYFDKKETKRLCLFSPFIGEDLFEFFTTDSEFEGAVDSHGDVARFFRNDNGDAVALLRNAKGSAVAKSERFWDVGVVAHGEDASCRVDAFARDNHCAIVQRAVFEKDIFNESLTDVGIDEFARVHLFLKRRRAFDDDECAHLLF